MKSGDLVIIEISGDKGLRRKAAADLPDVRTGQANFIETIKIGRRIIAHCRHDHRLATQQHQIVGNIAGTATELATHFRNQKGDIQDVNLLGKNMVLKRSGKTMMLSKASEPQIRVVMRNQG